MKFKNGNVINPTHEENDSIRLFNLLGNCLSIKDLIVLSKLTILDFCPFQEHLKELLKNRELSE